jgi:hypothetical protein
MKRTYSSALATLSVLLTLTAPVGAKDKKSKADPKDEIRVVGHIALTGGPVRRFFITEHYSQVYLYAERDSGNTVALIDVTKPGQPAMLGDVVSAPGDSGRLTLVAGTAGLVATGPAAAASDSQTIRIMDFSDPRNPKVAREFSGVTAMSRDDRRGLVFLANGEGVWILQQHLATDPDVIKAYDNYLFYGPSLYPPGK